MYRVCTCSVWGWAWSYSVVWNESLSLFSWTSSWDEGGGCDRLVEEESTLPEERVVKERQLFQDKFDIIIFNPNTQVLDYSSIILIIIIQ